MDTFDEVELVNGLLKCEPESCQILVNRYAPRLFGYIRKRISSHEDAEELLNDVFYAIITKIDQYDRQKGDFETWIFSISVNKVRDYLRRQKIRQEELTKAGVTSLVSLADFDTPIQGPMSEKLLTKHRSQKAQTLSSVLEQLSERDRSILIWHYNGLSNGEIANYLGIAIANVRVYLSRAKHRLMTMLRNKPEFNDFFRGMLNKRNEEKEVQNEGERNEQRANQESL